MNEIKDPNQFNEGFSFKENKSFLKISFERIAFIFFIFFILAIIFSSKVILLSLKKFQRFKGLLRKRILDLVF